MNNISPFSIVFYEGSKTWGQLFHNGIESVLKIPHLQKTYRITDIQKGEASLDQIPPTAKDYLLTAAKIAFFIVAGSKVFALFATLVVIDRFCYRFVIADDKKPIPKNETTKPEPEPLKPILDECLQSLIESFSKDSKRRPPIGPEGYITNAFKVLNRNLETPGTISLIESKKETLLDEAIKAIQPSKNGEAAIRKRISCQFDIEISDLLKKIQDDTEQIRNVKLDKPKIENTTILESEGGLPNSQEEWIRLFSLSFEDSSQKKPMPPPPEGYIDLAFGQFKKHLFHLKTGSDDTILLIALEKDTIIDQAVKAMGHTKNAGIRTRLSQHFNTSINKILKEALTLSDDANSLNRFFDISLILSEKLSNSQVETALKQQLSMLIKEHITTQQENCKSKAFEVILPSNDAKEAQILLHKLGKLYNSTYVEEILDVFLRGVISQDLTDKEWLAWKPLMTSKYEAQANLWNAYVLIHGLNQNIVSSESLIVVLEELKGLFNKEIDSKLKYHPAFKKLKKEFSLINMKPGLKDLSDIEPDVIAHFYDPVAKMLELPQFSEIYILWQGFSIVCESKDYAEKNNGFMNPYHLVEIAKKLHDLFNPLQNKISQELKKSSTFIALKDALESLAAYPPEFVPPVEDAVMIKSLYDPIAKGIFDLPESDLELTQEAQQLYGH